MSMQTKIEAKLKEALSPEHLEVINESYRHHVPAGAETHFKVILVSRAFEGKTPVARHREVYRCLELELKKGVHALSVQAFSPAEWEKESSTKASPPCLGGSKTT